MKMFRKILSVVLAFVICFAVVGGGVAVAGVEDMTMIGINIHYHLDDALWDLPDWQMRDEETEMNTDISNFLDSLGDFDVYLTSTIEESRKITFKEDKTIDSMANSPASRYVAYFPLRDGTQDPQEGENIYYIPIDEFNSLYVFVSNIESGVQYSVTEAPIPRNYELTKSSVNIGIAKSWSGVYIDIYLKPTNISIDIPDEQQPNDPADDTTSDNTQPDEDMPPSNPTPGDQPAGWAAEHVSRAIGEDIVPEFFQEKYAQPATREEFCSLGVALYEKFNGEILGRREFTDTENIDVQKMAYIGVVGGTNAEGTLFNPTGNISRAGAAALLTNLANAIGKPLPAGTADFTDIASIPPWALQAVGQVQAAGIMGSTSENNTFSPNDLYSRQQSIITILLLYDAIR
jgi:hypothetical protein